MSFETPEQHTRRLRREAKWATIGLLLLALLVLFGFISWIARGVVWIRWAFS